MYTYVSAMTRSQATQARWNVTDVSSMSFEQIYTQFTACVITLTNPFIDGEVGFDVFAYKPKIGSNIGLSISAFLTANGDTTLPTATIPVVNTHYVTYGDAFKSGFSVVAANIQYAPDAVLPEKDKPDLFLRKSSVNMDTVFKNCLVSVNGFIHRTDGSTDGLWVKDGMRSVWLSNQAQAGLLDFENVSPFTLVTITKDMIYKQSPDQSYKNVMRINVGQDLSNKTVGLVLGGYLHLFDSQVFYRIGLTQVAIDFNNLPLLERYHESRDYIDYSSMPFQTTSKNPSQIAVNDFYSDANLAAYVMLSQSFLILFDNPTMFKDYPQYVQSKLGPGMLVSYVKPVYPLTNGIGKLADYWSVFEDGQWALSVVDNNWNRRVYETVPATNLPGINVADSRITHDPVRYSKATFLKIGTDNPPLGSPANPGTSSS